MATVTTTVNGEKNSQARQADESATSAGLQIERQFCPSGVTDPFDTVEWELRSAGIKD